MPNYIHAQILSGKACMHILSLVLQQAKTRAMKPVHILRDLKVTRWGRMERTKKTWQHPHFVFYILFWGVKLVRLNSWQKENMSHLMRQQRGRSTIIKKDEKQSATFQTVTDCDLTALFSAVSWLLLEEFKLIKTPPSKWSWRFVRASADDALLISITVS